LRKLLFFMFGLLAAGGAQAQEDDYYKIRAGDQISVSVLEDPNLNQTVLVRPDGRITLPIAGSVTAEGLSPERLEQVLQSRFARGFEITPTVTVSLRYIASQGEQVGEEMGVTTIFFLGQVQKPGPLVLEEPVSILKALALVGGPARFAKLDSIQIRRKVDPVAPPSDEGVSDDGVEGDEGDEAAAEEILVDDGPEEILIFNYELIEDGEFAQENIMLEDGDVVVVPERGLFD
jgi:polysaccharide biosynthesis/export protein